MTFGIRWEAGSMFHWETEFAPPVWQLPEPSVSYLVCRHAIAALCAAQPSRPVLWLPTFFCPEVASFCRPLAEIREYRDDCRWPEPEWSTLNTGTRDLVLAVNYFGIRSPEPWRKWRKNHPCVLVEDHTQDPFSVWSLESNADYAVCSLRKTLPLPDGAILWSPVGRLLPVGPSTDHWQSSMLRLSAMVYKRDYLLGTVPAECKPRYRELQLSGERELSAAEISSMSPVSQAILTRGVPKQWREKRIENARALLEAIDGWRIGRPVFTKWPQGSAPFDVPVVFQDATARDKFQQRLREQNIFCPVEWVCETSDPDASDLSSRILSIPIDHRYSPEDMSRISSVLVGICS